MRYVTTWWALAGLLVFSVPEAARAQMGGEGTFDQVEATPKGTIGLGLLGAELGFLVPAAVGLDETWAFVVFPVLGATGGALGGYFLLDSANVTTASVATLVAGMLLVVPTTVWTLSLTAYDPDDDAEATEPVLEESRAGPAIGPLRPRSVLAAEPQGMGVQLPVLSLHF